jgi:choline dehydrogenase-like flavoprotein
VVVGGGIGGIAAAVALARAGIDVRVYEQAQQLAEVGAGVSLAPNGLRMLERLGVGEGVVAYRGLVPRPEEYPADAMRMWVGESKHFLVFPVRAGQLLNYVGFVPSDTSVRESWSAPGDPAALAAHFAGWDPVIGEVIAAISGPDGSGFQWGMYDRAPLPDGAAGG